MNPAPPWLYAIRLTVRDCEASARFYRDVLGLESDAPDATDFMIGEIRLELAGDSWPERGCLMRQTIRIVLADIHRVFERCPDQFRVSGPRRTGEGSIAVIEDPDGNRWDLLEPSEVVLKTLRARRHRLGPIPDLGLDPPGPRRP